MLRPCRTTTPQPPPSELRPWSPDDLDLMTALLGDPAMTEHLGGPESPEQLRKRLDEYLAMTPGRRPDVRDHARRRRASRWAPVGYWPRESDSLETGLERAAGVPGARRRDAAAPRQCLDLAAAEGGYDTIHAYPSVDNAASNALCRRLGFELVGPGSVRVPEGPLDDLQRLVARPPGAGAVRRPGTRSPAARVALGPAPARAVSAAPVAG